MEEWSPIKRVATNILNKQWLTTDRWLVLGEVITIPDRKNIPSSEIFIQ
jgi:hypothetical protein